MSDEDRQGLRTAFVLGQSQSIYQDPLFGINQLVDIALKALSPGVNDPTTAEQCIAQLGDIVGELATREFPQPLRILEGGGRVLVSRPSFEDFVEASFSQLRRNSQNNVHVTNYLLGALHHIAKRIPDETRAEAIRSQVEEVLTAVKAGQFSVRDKKTIKKSAFDVQKELESKKMNLLVT